MAEVLRFHFDNFQLTVDRKSYLVEVQEARESTDAVLDQEYYNMPEWVFQSKHAIWLSTSGASVRERASKGEAIKSEILRQIRCAH